MKRVAAFVVVIVATLVACGLPKDSALCGPNGTNTCASSGRVCTSSGCAQCALDSDCSAFATTQLCLEGTCVECAANEDCDSKSSCWSDHQCHDPCTAGACPASASMCVVREDESNAACVQCQVNADCAGTPATPVCDYQLDSCVECVLDSQCPTTTPKCLGDRCVECTRNSDCPNAGATCTPVTFKCSS